MINQYAFFSLKEVIGIIPCRGLNRSLPKDVDLGKGQLTVADESVAQTYLNDIPY